MDLGLEVSEHDRWSVLAVDGEVDVATAPKLREKLIDLVNAGVSNIVVDLGRVDFLDSTGLGVLVGALKRIRTVDGELALVCDERRILKVFEITGLTKVFTMYPTVDEAVTAG